MLKDEQIINHPLEQELLLAWWRLRQLPRFGAQSVGQLRNYLNSPEELIGIQYSQLRQAGMSEAAANAYLLDPKLSLGFDQLMRWQQQDNQGILLVGKPPYPQALSHLTDAPLILWYRGNLKAIAHPMLAIVGSRNATASALEWTHHCAHMLAEAGICIVSGLAHGIDGVAHQGAVTVPSGRTIAVMGTGADVIYPARHNKLANQILNQGLLLTEFPPGTQPNSRHFPSRNRIISGLSQATLIVEASIRSGTMITARLAAEQGRDVFAMPGSINNPLSKGPHQLIRDGALLVESAQDILEALVLDPGFLPSGKVQSTEKAVQPESINNTPNLVTLIDFSTTSLDVISLRSQMDVANLLPELLQLELDGWINSTLGGYIRLR